MMGENLRSEPQKIVTKLSDLKEKDLETVANHLERLRNEKFNPEVHGIGQILSNNIEQLRNNKRMYQFQRAKTNGAQTLKAEGIYTKRQFEIDLDSELIQDLSKEVHKELFRLKAPSQR